MVESDNGCAMLQPCFTTDNKVEKIQIQYISEDQKTHILLDLTEEDWNKLKGSPLIVPCSCRIIEFDRPFP